MEYRQPAAEFVTTFACSVFAGAALHITLVEHPATMACGIEIAATEFSPSYRRAAVMQASLAIAGFVFAVIAWLTGGTARWLVGGLLLVSVVPFTLLVIMPTNKALLDSSLDKSSARAAELLSRWAQLHAVRSLISILALGLFLSLLMVSRVP